MALDTSVDQQATLLYEKEVQTYLSENLHLLGDSQLVLIQTEYPIKFGKDSGRIDVLAKDANEDLVVIEVKRGVAGRSAVGQVQSYMGSLVTEFPNKKIRGLLVAMGLDEAARAALLVTHNIGYFEFKTRFDFMRIEITKPEVIVKLKSYKDF
jgi:RecB family endonuclease NucS